MKDIGMTKMPAEDNKDEFRALKVLQVSYLIDQAMNDVITSDDVIATLFSLTRCRRGDANMFFI